MSWLDPALAAEGARIMTICNACRYCEGYCAVFPAMEKRMQFEPSDLGYLANLCHNCGACLPACQYAPPHEFGVNVPQTLTKIRLATYQLPATRSTALTILGVVIFFFLTVLVTVSPAVVFARHDGGGFFDVIPHNVMVLIFLAAGIFAALRMLVGVQRYRRETADPPVTYASLKRALADAFSLVNLGGGGEGCIDESERPSQIRRAYHHLAFYGFLACFAATLVAAFYDNALGWRAPYPFFSVPVLLGTFGGIALLAGSVGLLVLSRNRETVLTDRQQRAMDTVFIVMLLLTASTGLLLLVFRGTAVMGVLLAVHLAIVFALFLTMPFGKFVHGFYRLAALIRFATEEGN
jgi:citrate/tricarballylate utilization protein